MLVLSRRQNESIVFPNLGITVQIIRVAGKTVRIGVDAPPEVRVLREEVAHLDNQDDGNVSQVSRSLRHALRNRLNTVSLGLQVLHRRLEMGDSEDTESAIYDVVNELLEIDKQLLNLQEPKRNAGSSHNRRALIVEDNANESELLAAYLRMHGYQVDTVDDGLKAIRYLKQNQLPDAVLLDMCMPRLDGPKTVTSIRCEPNLKGLKLFAVTGADREEVGIEVGPRGVDRWFSKPVNAVELVQEMRRDLDKSLVSA